MVASSNAVVALSRSNGRANRSVTAARLMPARIHVACPARKKKERREEDVFNSARPKRAADGRSALISAGSNSCHLTLGYALVHDRALVCAAVRDTRRLTLSIHTPARVVVSLSRSRPHSHGETRASLARRPLDGASVGPRWPRWINETRVIVVKTQIDKCAGEHRGLIAV